LLDFLLSEVLIELNDDIVLDKTLIFLHVIDLMLANLLDAFLAAQHLDNLLSTDKLLLL